MRKVMRALWFTAVLVTFAQAAHAAEGVPAWVNRGSAAFNGGGKRAFYGVGAASGIKNPALLRQTADNRARAEMGKVFETFSASLMKDYCNSSGEQNVENAVKTFSSMSLEGVEMVDHYIDGDGTMYALAMLDIEKVANIIQQAKAQGLVKSSVTPVAVDDIFDKNGKKAEPPKPVVASGADAGGTSAPKDATSGAKTATGGKPAWVDGVDPKYPLVQFLCAVGYGTKRDIAENGAYSAMAKVFVVNVESASKDFMGAYSSSGGPSLEVQASETLTKTSTQKILSGVRIPETWQDKESTIFALSCLERPKTAATVRQKISELDGKAKTALGRAEGLDPAGKLKELSRALDALIEREALNAELRIIDVDGIGVNSEYTLYDVAAALEDVQNELRVGVFADGPFAEDFRGALIESLTGKGYKIEDLAENDPSGLDVLVAANIRFEDAGAGTGSAAAVQFARGVIQVELKNVQQGKIIGNFKESRREGHRSLEEAERRVVRELAKKLSQQVGTKIDNTMKGKK